MNATIIKFPAERRRPPMATRTPPTVGTQLLRWCMLLVSAAWCWALIVLALSW